MGRKKIWLHLVPAVSAVLLFSCNPTKYVPEGETLLEKNRLKISNEGIKASQVEPYIRQQPNKKIFGTRFHLGLYNMSNIDSEKGINRWLRNIGEGPAVFDPYAMSQSVEQIKSFAYSKGYFDAEVADTAETGRRRTVAQYSVNLKTPYTIRGISYDIADTNLKKLYVFDTINSMIVRGSPYDVDVLQQERQRFEKFVRDHGFYRFSSDYISFSVDSAVGNRQVDIVFVVKNASEIDENDIVKSVPHSIFRLNNIYIYDDFDPYLAIEEGSEYFNKLDTGFYRGYYFIGMEKKPAIKYDFIIQSLYMRQGAIYNQTNTELSQSRMMASRVYRLVNINFNETGNVDDYEGEQIRAIDCVVQLTHHTQQSYRVELEGTHSGGALGGAMNLAYQHNNMFHGAEQFTLKLKGSYEAIRQDGEQRPAQEYGVETGLRLPDFLLPFYQNGNFVRRYNPATNIAASYNYQDMPFYTRTMASMSFGYNWRNGYNEHIVNPLQFNIVKLASITPDFAEQVNKSSYLAYAYRDVLILGGNYSYIFNNQMIKKSRDYWFIRWNIETAGNMLRSYNRKAHSDEPDTAVFRFLNQPFAQYVKTDIDIRYNYAISPDASVVYRGFFGVAVPYGNSKAIPFERQYFAGGANSIRGWQARTLGPGSDIPASNTFLNQTADIKIELNMEYRYKLFWVLEGAVFADAGNIWTYSSDPARPGVQFKFDRFYKDIAVGAGTGLRFDFSFFLARLDFGMKLRDPVIPATNKWIFSNRPYGWSDFTTVIAIGYPF
ncbi:MAG: outer membrane protein assembly factor [Bacteroidales bacterium]|nr:outer membrane protein assembly factor [Bacteroidales bacterium]